MTRQVENENIIAPLHIDIPGQSGRCCGQVLFIWVPFSLLPLLSFVPFTLLASPPLPWRAKSSASGGLLRAPHHSTCCCWPVLPLSPFSTEITPTLYQINGTTRSGLYLDPNEYILICRISGYGDIFDLQKLLSYTMSIHLLCLIRRLILLEKCVLVPGIIIPLKN